MKALQELVKDVYRNLKIEKKMYVTTVKCMICGKKFKVKTNENWEGWQFSGISGLPKHECKEW